MAIQQFTIAGTDTRIYAEPDNLNFFLNTPLTPDTAAGSTTQTSAVRSHTRRQYPGDTSTINVSASNREFLVDPGRRSGTPAPRSPGEYNSWTNSTPPHLRRRE